MSTKAATKPLVTNRVDIIGAVKTYLGFFVLLVLVVEAVLGALALKEGPNQLVALYGMLFVIVALIAVVSFFAYSKPETLLRTFGAAGSAEVQSPPQDFCERIAGHWWEWLTPDEPNAISFIQIGPDRATNTVRMTGRAYTRAGKFSATWRSIAACLNPGEHKVFYYWDGRHPARPNEPFEGFGEISFQVFANRFEAGSGIFSDTNVTDMKSTTKKTVELRRSTSSEIQIMQEGDEARIGDLVRKKLG